MKWLYRLLINWIDRLNEEQCEILMVLRCVLVTLAAMSLGSAVLAMIWNVNDKFVKVMFSISIVTIIMLLLLACIV